MTRATDRNPPPAPLLAAMNEDPTDLGLRLDFADWLGENGQADRAQWVRLCCEFSQLQCPLERQQPFWHCRGSRDIPLGPSLAARLRLRSLKQELLPLFFERCGPGYWGRIAGVRQTPFFGRFILTVVPRPGRPWGTIPPAEGDFDWPAATRRLGRAGWLADAYRDGWLEGLDLPLYDANQALALLDWPDRSLLLPLWVSTEDARAERFNDRLMRRLLAVPGLRGLEMLPQELAFPCMRQLAELAGNLQHLRVWGLSKAGPSTRLLEQLPRLRRLRTLELGGAAPEDRQVIPLVGHPRLRSLFLYSDRLTDDCLTVFRKARVLRTLGIDGGQFTRQGIQALREANPRLSVVVGDELRLRFGPI